MRNSDRPLVLVSACLLGQAVRYDGTDRLQHWVEALSQYCRLEPICPEVAAGLGVPRPPVQLVQAAQGVRALGVVDANLDVTHSLQLASAQILATWPQAAGMVLKARSPSCGLASASLFSSSGEQVDTTSGLFAAAATAAKPGCPMVDESRLVDEQGLHLFVEQVRRYNAAHSRLI